MLTGLFNRRQTNKQLAVEIKRFNPAEHSLFVVMIDVDLFKAINDELGHVVGDQALVAVSSVLISSCREKDFVARLGGDEFIIMGYADNAQDVDEVIAKIDSTVAEYNAKNISPFTYSKKFPKSFFNLSL